MAATNAGKELYGPQFPSSSSTVSSQLTTDVTECLYNPSDDEFRGALARYGQEKNGSSLSAVKQLARLNVEFPLLNNSAYFSRYTS